jgi:hypothetical protein
MSTPTRRTLGLYKALQPQLLSEPRRASRMKPIGRGAIGRPRPISKLSDCLLPYRDRHDLILRTQSSRR